MQHPYLLNSARLSAQQDLNIRPGLMQTKVIPKSGEQLPVVGLGTLEAFNVAENAPERKQLGQVLNILANSGGTLVDTSPSPRYGVGEAALGEIAAEQILSENLFFATKVFSEGKQAGIDEVNTSFNRLKVSQIDLMQVHSLRDWQTHIPSIQKLKDEGRVRYLGVTIHRDSGHAEMMKVMREQDLDFVQVNYNLIERAAADKLFPLAQENDTAVLVNVPFAKAELFNITRDIPLPDLARDIQCGSWPQFFLKYIVSHPAVTCVIPRTSKVKHMADNIRGAFGKQPDQQMRLAMEKIIDGLL
ncbi:MAG: aldo/keto reductase [Acidiferrobacterales bacterium]|nr:aldo/keto reductase [Acidiferrobacterales bacterium]